MDGSAARPPRGSILAYFSHSYREADREVNAFFWTLFQRHGFFFTVDPQSQFFSIPYLESMMALSNCFVAVIPKRAGAALGCSPYILFEYGLAVEAQKPWLVFVEQGLSGQMFPRDRERVVVFNRNRLSDLGEELGFAVRRLADRVRGTQNPDVRLQQPAGLVVGDGPGATQAYTPVLVQALAAEMAKYGRPLEPVDHDFDPSFRLCVDLENYDFLIMETREPLQSPWLAGFVLGRAVPTIRVCHLAPGETPQSVALPPVVARHRPPLTTEPPVVYWHDASELIAGVMPHVNKFGTQRIELHTEEDGLRYFRRAGRSDGKVFVSNAAGVNALAHKVVAGLRHESIDFFHYQVKEAIPVGEDWLEKLEAQIEGSEIFVALLSPEYLESQWCLFELQIARKLAAEGRLELHPYLLDGVRAAHLPLLGIGAIQAQDVIGWTPEEVAEAVVSNVDKGLRRTGTPRGAEHTTARDVPVRTLPHELPLTEEERRNLVEILEGRLTTVDGPQRSAWIRGALIHAQLYALLAGEDYSGNARAAATTLVTATEGLGLLPDGTPAVLPLLRALHDHQLVSHQRVPAICGMVDRLEGLARDPG